MPQAKASAANPETDALVRRAQSGDRVAWRALFDAFRGPVFSYCLLACNHNRADAMDLMQDVFVRVFRALGTLKEAHKFRSWVFTIAANTSRNRWSANASRRRAMEGFLLEQDIHLTSQADPERNHRDEVVRQALANIEDETMRKIAWLKYTDPEHTTRQIAEKLGIPHGTVTVKLVRFRKRFKASLIALLGADNV